MHRPFATEVATKSSTTQHTFIKLLFSLFTPTQKLVCTFGEGCYLVLFCIGNNGPGVEEPTQVLICTLTQTEVSVTVPLPWHQSPAEKVLLQLCPPVGSSPREEDRTHFSGHLHFRFKDPNNWKPPTVPFSQCPPKPPLSWMGRPSLLV